MLRKFIYNDLKLSTHFFDPTLSWTVPIPKASYHMIRTSKCTESFDHNGYDLCPLEKLYAQYNTNQKLKYYRGFRPGLHREWFIQDKKLSGYVLNHSMLLERKGYNGLALEQLKEFAQYNPLIHRMINYRTKWGLDFSLDYIDTNGKCFEIFHYEYDSFDYDKIIEVKKSIENLVTTTDFNEVARDLESKKSEWYNLEFFDQSKWKTNYFKTESERFKMVGWQK